MNLRVSIDAEIEDEYVRSDLVTALDVILGYMTDNFVMTSHVSNGEGDE